MKLNVTLQNHYQNKVKYTDLYNAFLAEFLDWDRAVLVGAGICFPQVDDNIIFN